MLEITIVIIGECCESLNFAICSCKHLKINSFSLNISISIKKPSQKLPFTNIHNFLYFPFEHKHAKITVPLTCIKVIFSKRLCSRILELFCICLLFTEEIFVKYLSISGNSQTKITKIRSER